MRRFTTRLLVCICVVVAFNLLLLNTVNFLKYTWPFIESANDLVIHWTFDFSILKGSVWRSVMFGVDVLIAVLILFDPIASLDSKKRKTKYDKKSFSHLLTNHERRRGTQLVVFSSRVRTNNATGEVTGIGDVWNQGLLKMIQRVKDPIARIQNKLMSHYFRPDTEKFNVLNLDDLGNEIVVSGIPVMAMREYFLFGKFNKVWYLTGDKHSFFIGSTGRGKTFTYVLPMIHSSIMAGESIVVHDPKRELDALSRTLLESHDYKIITIDFVNQENSDGWNPLAVAFEAWMEACKEELSTWDKLEGVYVKEITVAEHLDESDHIVPSKKKTIFIPEGEEHRAYEYANVSEATEQVMDIARTLCWQEDAKDPFWHEGAGDMFAGGALLMMEEGNPDYVNPKSVRYLIELGDDPDEKGKPLLKKYLEKYRRIDSESTRKYATYLDAEGPTRTSLKSVFKNKVSLLTSTDNIMDLTAKSTFNMHQIFKEKTAVFLKTHDEKATYYPLVTMFLKQLYEVGIKESRKNPMRRLDIPMNWYIDEFGLLPELMDIEALYGAARSRGIRLNTFAQTFEQVQDKYEADIAKVLEDNSSNVIYLGSQSKTTLERFSAMSGTELVWDKKKQEYIERLVITEGHLKSFERGRSMISSIEWNPYIAKLPPYNKYVFYREPIWDEIKIEKPRAKYFDIKLEWHKKLAEERVTFDKKVGSTRATRGMITTNEAGGISKVIERTITKTNLMLNDI